MELHNFFYNLFGVDPQLIVGILLVIIVSGYFSYQIQNGFGKIILFIAGVYLVISTPTDIFNFIGIGLFLPHLRYIYHYLKMQLFILMQIGLNGYYLYLSLYYKTKNIFKWLIDLLKAIQEARVKDFFTKQNQEHEFNYDKYQHYQKFYDESKYQQQEETKQEKSYSHDYQDTKQEQSKSYQQNKEQKSSSSSSSQFDSASAYTILGVSPDDDKKTIKKAYRELMQKHHPDRNPNNIEEATVVAQKINGAYDKIKKMKGF